MLQRSENTRQLNSVNAGYCKRFCGNSGVYVCVHRNGISVLPLSLTYICHSVCNSEVSWCHKRAVPSDEALLPPCTLSCSCNCLELLENAYRGLWLSQLANLYLQPDLPSRIFHWHISQIWRFSKAFGTENYRLALSGEKHLAIAFSTYRK